MDQRTRHVEAARTRLAHLAVLADRTTAAERKVLEAAEDRLAAVNADLDTLRPRTQLEDGAADQYMRLIAERGQLEIVIARARQELEAVPE